MHFFIHKAHRPRRFAKGVGPSPPRPTTDIVSGLDPLIKSAIVGESESPSLNCTGHVFERDIFYLSKKYLRVSGNNVKRFSHIPWFFALCVILCTGTRDLQIKRAGALMVSRKN
jgi:hypothetical protein